MRWRPLVAVAVPVATFSAAALLHFYPVGSLPYPPCPWFALTGTFCPGCGVTRAFSALVDGDVLLAFRQNLLLLPALLFLGWAYLRLLASLRPALAARLPGRVSARLLAPARPRPLLLVGVLGVVLSWWVLRNLPFLSFLAPLPVV